jgi:hypothetical protein
VHLKVRFLDDIDAHTRVPNLSDEPDASRQEIEAAVSRDPFALLMPRFIRWFGWWLFVNLKKPAWVEPAGLLAVVGLYAIEIASLWHLLPW